MKFFGEAIEAQEESGTGTKKRGPQNLLDLLPDIFTREEARQMRIRYGVKNGTLTSMLSTWKNRKYIELYGEVMDKEELDKQQYIKTEFYQSKKGSVTESQITVY